MSLKLNCSLIVRDGSSMTLIRGFCMRHKRLSIDTGFVSELAEGVGVRAFSCTLESESANLSGDIYREKKKDVSSRY
jgi:hypothetical protein